MNIVHSPIPENEQDELIVLSARLRTYAALSTKGERFHLIQPAQLADPRVGDGKRIVGELVCSCEAGLYARLCWAVRLAESFEKGLMPPKAEDLPPWLADGAPGEIVEAMGR